MKKFLLTLSLIGVCVASQTAAADSRHNRHGYSYYPGHSYSSNHRRHNGYDYYRRSNNSYHYGRRDRRRNHVGFSFGSRGYYSSYSSYYGRNSYRYSPPYYYGSRHRYGSSDVGSFVGGMVLGSILNSAITPRDNYVERVSPAYRSYPAAQEVVYVNEASSKSRTYSTNKPRLSGRKLIKDRDGNCFERIVNEEGDEVRVQLEAEECAY